LLYDWSWKLVDLVYLTLDPVLWVWCPFSDPSLRTAWVKVSDLGYEIGAEVAELESRGPAAAWAIRLQTSEQHP